MAYNRSMLFRVAQIAIPFIWFGLLGGISFMEAPLKFQAPGVTLPVGLGIGRLVFQTLNKIEILLAILMLISFVKVRPKGKFPRYSYKFVVLLLFLQTVWLLPFLDARAAQIISGVTPPDSYLHFVYIAFDVLKFVLLFALGTSLAKKYMRVDEK